jgi:hypothetical protein
VAESYAEKRQHFSFFGEKMNSRRSAIGEDKEKHVRSEEAGRREIE